MNLNSLGARNLLRNRFRSIATALGVATAILAFIMLRTVITAWTDAADYAAKDRIASRHKVSFIMTMPIRYVQEIREMPGVIDAGGALWFGGKHPTRDQEFFATIAVEAQPFLKVYNELVVPAAEAESWRQNRRGALVGKVLARKFGWKVGDKVTLRGTIYPGDWEFEVSSIYDSNRRSVDLASFFFHYDYLNERADERARNQVGWIAARLENAELTTRISQDIDRRFEERDIQTISMDEGALNKSFLGMFSAMLKAMDLVSVVILVIMMLILGNTVAMGVRERTHEYGVLRAMGFLPRHLTRFILGEAVVLGVAGGVLGVAASYPIVQEGLGRFLEENMGAFFPYFRIRLSTALMALACAALLGLLAAAIPAFRAARLNVVDALRRVG